MKLSTKLSIEECRNRIIKAAEPPQFILGEFRGNSFRLRTRKFYMNSFAPLFYGKFSGRAGGSTLEGEFRMHTLVRLFMVFWYSFLALFAVALVVVPARIPLYRERDRWMLLAALGGLALFGFLFITIGRWLARDEKTVIHNFLKTTLEAEDEPGAKT